MLVLSNFHGHLLLESKIISVPLHSNSAGQENKYFGTDGFHGEINKTLTPVHAFKIGRFLGWYFSSPLSGCTLSGYRPQIVVGKDTRRSSYMLEYAVAAGITASGADAYMLHVTTTPSVSYVARQDEFDCSIMITASHNPFFDNGIKIINRYGEKFDDASTALVEKYLDGNMDCFGSGEDLPLALRENIGKIIDYSAGRNRYIGYLISIASNSYKGLNIGLDCANGSTWMIAKAVFDALGAHTYVIGAQPDGDNINLNVGSTHIEALCELVKEKHLDVGFAFDGDADRCIAVDENGKVVDGDSIMYILAKRFQQRGLLKDNTVIATIMSNSGFFASLKKEGIRCEQTTVGDRFVYERMQEKGYSIGGEQSGHIIIRKYATTGDGLLTAIILTEEICDRKLKLAALCESITLYPQYVLSVKVKNKNAVLTNKNVKEMLSEIEKKINEKGRIFLRKSGTEPKIRILVECENQEMCKEYAEAVKDVMQKEGLLDD